MKRLLSCRYPSVMISSNPFRYYSKYYSYLVTGSTSTNLRSHWKNYRRLQRPPFDKYVKCERCYSRCSICTDQVSTHSMFIIIIISSFYQWILFVSPIQFNNWSLGDKLSRNSADKWTGKRSFWNCMEGKMAWYWCKPFSQFISICEVYVRYSYSSLSSPSLTFFHLGCGQTIACSEWYYYWAIE